MNNTKRVLTAVALAGAALTIAGPAAQATDGPILPGLSRITALDPAGPAFAGPNTIVTGLAAIAPVAAPDQYWR
ncbi:hypothetical protein [Streptomyces exfoliatus]|uniref:hypothetical protein n=1 Tax=Streptomyces exfoliatus TaxID=1905 RepID=UPI0004C92A2D|nr:hypothetical protein [Streptomyces exfoliatus]